MRRIPFRLSTLAPVLFNLKEQSASHLELTCAVIIFLGGAFRLSQYIANRSLWLDEAMLSLNIIHRSYLELAQPLDYSQVAPLGFLWVEKLLIELFSNRDYTLRIFPLVCGLTSLWVMFAVARRLLIEPLVILTAVVLFAISDRLIYYASEVKQYSSDVLVGLLLLLAIGRGLDRPLLNRDFALLAALGAAAPWFSHPSLFIMAGSGSVLGAHFILTQDRRSILKLASVAAAWMVSFFILYFVSLRGLSPSGDLLAYWEDSFVPFPPWRDWGWFVYTSPSAFTNPLGLPAISAVLLSAIGGLSIVLRRWQLGAMLLLPILLTLAASALHKYPFSQRLLLFLVPIVLLFIAEAIRRIYSLLLRIERLAWRDLALALAVSMWAAALVIPAYHAVQHLWQPRLKEEIRPVMAYLNTNRQDNDMVYVYYSAGPAFRYYSTFYNLDKTRIMWGGSSRHNNEGYFRDLNLLRGKGRLWIVFSHNFNREGVNEQSIFLDYLDQIGTRLTEHGEYNSSVYLYVM